MADMNDLGKYMDRLNAPISIAANEIARQTALAILADLIQSTPADTGLAVSNWIVTLDAPAANVIPAYVPSPKGHTRKGLWTHVVDPLATIQANAPSILDQAKTILAAKQPGQPIYITNNVEYIQILDGGSSDQSPAGFVERAQIVAGYSVAGIVAIP